MWTNVERFGERSILRGNTDIKSRRRVQAMDVLVLILASRTPAAVARYYYHQQGDPVSDKAHPLTLLGLVSKLFSPGFGLGSFYQEI